MRNNPVPDTEKIFLDLLKLRGKKLEVASASKNKPLKGVLTNVMFDSFILSSEKGPEIVRFSDVLTLESLD